MIQQKKIFLKSEANKFFKRNIERLSKTNYKKHKIVIELQKYLKSKKNKINLLEIGCCDAGLINFISQKYNKIECYGVDPSSLALKLQKNSDLKLKIGTADKLLFKKDFFDIVIYNFCLYLCDNDDLIKIVSEADRVLKKNGMIFILDFYHKNIKYIKYIHQKNIYSRKMNYSKLFTWHPNYQLKKLKKFQLENNNTNFKDQKLNTIGLYVIKKIL